MNPLVKKDILNVLRQTVEYVKKGETYKLRDLSDHVIKNATIFQDHHSISIAVTIYSLSKIYKGKVDNVVVKHLNNSISYLEVGDVNGYENEIKLIIKDISKKSEETKFYIEEVLERSQIKKASKMYEHGISMGQVAESLGISVWDLMDYIGKTRIPDANGHKYEIAQKLEFTRGLFK